MQERQVWLLGWKGPSEKNGNLLQNSSLGNPGTEETGWLQSTGPLTVWTQLSNDTTIYQATVPVVPQTDLELWGTVCEHGSQHILEALLWVLPLERLSPLFSACLPHVPVPITIPFSSDFTIFHLLPWKVLLFSDVSSVTAFLQPSTRCLPYFLWLLYSAHCTTANMSE